MTRRWWPDYCVRDGLFGGAIPLRPRHRKSEAPFSWQTHRPCSLRRRQSQGQRTGVSALHGIGFGENALTLRAECWKCRGSLRLRSGQALRLRRPIRFAYRSAALRMTRRCGWTTALGAGSLVGKSLFALAIENLMHSFSSQTHGPSSLRRKQSQGQRTGVSALHDIGFGENALILCMTWRRW
jgi:hypothetical protein